MAAYFCPTCDIRLQLQVKIIGLAVAYVCPRCQFMPASEDELEGCRL